MPLLFHGNQIYFCSWPCGETGMLFMDSLLTVYQLLDGNIFHSSESFFTKVPSADMAPSLHNEQLDTSNCPPSRSLSEARRAAGCFLDEVRQSIFELWSSSCATADSRTDSKPGRCRTACPWLYNLSNSRIFSRQLKRTSQIPSLVASWAFIFAQSKPGFGQFSFLCI